MIRRWGLTIPLEGITLPDHAALLREAEDLGYTDFWSYEAEVDPFVPLALAAVSTRSATLGTAIVGAFTRGPAIIAVGAAAMAEAAPGRFCLGIGAGSNVTVERWNGGRFDKPLTRVTEVVEAVRQALDGQATNVQGKTLSVSGFRVGRPVPSPVPIYLAALQERMLRQAVRIGDGVIINWLSAADVARVAAVVREEARAAGKDPDAFAIVCRIFVCATDDPPAARELFRRMVTAYLNVPVYRKFHDWLGHTDALRAMHESWDRGDRRGALAAVSDRIVDELCVIGTPDECRAHVRAYCDNGVTVPVLKLINLESDLDTRGAESVAMVRALRPA